MKLFVCNMLQGEQHAFSLDTVLSVVPMASVMKAVEMDFLICSVKVTFELNVR